MKSIQTKFIILILTGILLSSMIIGGVSVLSSQKVVKKDSAMIMNLLCSENAEELDQILGNIEQSVEIMADYALERLESIEKLKEESYREQYTDEMEKLLVNVGDNTDGAIAVYLRYNPDYTPPTAGLFWGKTELEGPFREFETTDFSCYSPSDVEYVGWYYIPVENGKPTWLLPYYNKNINVYMISYVIPLYKEDILVGIVGMDIEFQLLSEVVERITAYDTGSALLMDENGEIIYHKSFEEGIPGQHTDKGFQFMADELANETSESSLISYEYQGKERKLAFRKLSNGMRLAITAPSSEIDKEKNELIRQILIATVLICVFFIFITVRTARSIIRPLKELNEAAKKIAEGDLAVPLVHQTKDEVGTLADSFRQTVSHLKKYMDYINSLAYRDALTGVKNKMSYEEAVKNLEEQMHSGTPKFAVIIFDVNGLKTVNDTYGHDFGDMLIVNACRVIGKSFCNSSCYRIGGDEFAIILENSDCDNYRQLMKDFIMNMERENQNIADKKSRLSIASGVAVYSRETDMTYANVFRRADQAMYENKARMKAEEDKE